MKIVCEIALKIVAPYGRVKKIHNAIIVAIFGRSPKNEGLYYYDTLYRV